MLLAYFFRGLLGRYKDKTTTKQKIKEKISIFVLLFLLSCCIIWL